MRCAVRYMITYNYIYNCIAQIQRQNNKIYPAVLNGPRGIRHFQFCQF